MTIPYQAIEYHRLHPLIKDREVDAAVREAISIGLNGLCIPPYWVKKASRDILPAGIGLVTAIGYPYGYQRTEAKLAEMELAFTDGAQEIELTINLSALKSQCWNWIKVEIARFAKSVHDKEKILTVVMDTELLSQDELTRLCKEAADAGADNLKTTTSYQPAPLHVQKISHIRELLHHSVGLKACFAAGSIQHVQEALDAGADKICVPELTFLSQMSTKT